MQLHLNRRNYYITYVPTQDRYYDHVGSNPEESHGRVRVDVDHRVEFEIDVNGIQVHIVTAVVAVVPAVEVIVLAVVEAGVVKVGVSLVHCAQIDATSGDIAQAEGAQAGVVVLESGVSGVDKRVLSEG